MAISPQSIQALRSLASSMKKEMVKSQDVRNLSSGSDASTLYALLKHIESLTNRGEPGLDGYTPVKGKDYFTEKEIKLFLDEVTPVKGKDYNDGEDGYTPKKGVDYVDGKPGKDGKDGEDGADGEIDLGEVRRITSTEIGKYDKGIVHFPDQKGNAERFLSTDGSNPLWGKKITISATPPKDPKLHDIWIMI